MIGTALAIGLGVASAAGSVAGGALAAKGAGEQARAAENASAMSVAEQRRQFDITQKNMAPWLSAGKDALSQLEFLLGLGVPPGRAQQTVSNSTGIPPDTLAKLRSMGSSFSGAGPTAGWSPYINMGDWSNQGGAPGTATDTGVPAGMNAGDFGSLSKNFGASDFTADPGYDFRLQQGVDALQRSAASKGTALSGGTLKALSEYNQRFASNEYNNAYNRFMANKASRYNQLGAIAGVGQQTATQLGQFGQENANNIANLTVGGQTAAAAARASGYSAWGSAIGNAASLPLNWLALSRMNQPGAGSSNYSAWGGDPSSWYR